MKRSYAFPRKLVYKSFPLAMLGLVACGGSKTATTDDASTDGGRPCLVDDMVIPENEQGFCITANGSTMVCPQHACVPADCPTGCTYEPLV